MLPAEDSLRAAVQAELRALQARLKLKTRPGVSGD